jgi:hypothetical protein
MRALLCHCRTHLEASDDPALAEEVREHLLRDHAALRPTVEQVWEIVHTRAYDFEVYEIEKLLRALRALRILGNAFWLGPC